MLGALQLHRGYVSENLLIMEVYVHLRGPFKAILRDCGPSLGVTVGITGG